jgi:hypothetical protein
MAMDRRSVSWLPELLRKSVEKTLQRLMQEIRETGELSVLLTRAARGQRLTTEERKRMRAQLIDLAKVIPALVIFAAPGGVILLILLAKVLPSSLLPSAFTERGEGEPQATTPLEDTSPGAFAEQPEGETSAAPPKESARN